MEVNERRSTKRVLDHWRLESHSGAEVVSLRQLSAREKCRVTAPSMLTMGNMACGFSSILLALSNHPVAAAAIIIGSIVLDIADGAVARAIGATSPFGVQMDSLADLISFGLAPAILIYAWALPQWPVAAWAGAFVWLACAAFRLARFNFTVDPTEDKRYFVGLPSPGAAAVVVSTVFAMSGDELVDPQVRSGPSMVLLAVISVVPAMLMVSTIRFRSFRDLMSPRTGRTRLIAAACVVGVLAGLAFVPALTAVTLAYLYVLTAPLGVLTAPMRRRLFGEESIAPPRRRQQSVFLPLQDD